jgi:tubulin---tyrosine ligase
VRAAAADARTPAVVRADCPYSHRHLRAALARRSAQWQVVETDAGGTLTATEDGEAPPPPPGVPVVIDEYERIPWGQVMAPPYLVASSYCVRKGLGRKGTMAAALARHAKRCGRPGEGGIPTPGSCPFAAGRALPLTVPIDTTPVFLSRPAWLDYRSALAEALFEADDAVTAARDEAALAQAREGAGSGSGSGASPSPSPSPSPLWILKPSLTNKGAEIHIVKSVEEVERIVTEFPEMGQWVLQKYVENPLLLLLNPSPTPPSSGVAPPPSPPHLLHKFHLRVYVLAVGALSAFVYPESLVLIAPRAYTPDDPSLRTAHITNTCVGVGDEAFAEAAHVRSLSEMHALIPPSICAGRDPRALVAGIYADVCASVAHSFAAMEGDVGAYMPLPRCWELYGVDFLVSVEGPASLPSSSSSSSPPPRLQVVLLEFNPSPDIKQTGSRLDPVIDGMVDGMLSLGLDQRVKRAPAAAAGAAAGAAEAAGAGIEVDTAPFRVPLGGGGGGEGGTLGAPGILLAPVRDPVSGWDCVYTSYWGPAHARMNVEVK